ncbi:hypothetical protein Dimus_019268 [Dionaea muscipula]
MASPGNPNPPQQGPFDVSKFFHGGPHITPQNPFNFLGAPPPPFAPASSSYGPTPSASYPPPTGPYSFPHQIHQPFSHIPFPTQDQLPDLQHQRSASFTSPSVVPGLNPPPQNHGQSARLMAMLGNPSANFEYSHQPATSMPSVPPNSSGAPDFSVPVNVPILPPVHSLQAISVAIAQPGPIRMPSSKLPKGRRLVGDQVFYDVDARLQGEVQPQLEVTPITKYVSDPGLILGHQIAVSKTYICYGLKLGAIRVLNINTALRSLLRAHTQRVTDMAFFAEDVHLLASASIDGRVYAWKISEGHDEEDKPQILGNVVIGVHIIGVEGPIHPRVCWHCHKQEILVVAIGRIILRIDTIKVGKGELVTTEEPVICPLDKLIDGIQFVGGHDGEVTDLSMCQWMTTRLVSSSKDGTIKIWEDRKAQPLVVLRPHDGQPVDAAIFLTAPQRPDHVILITAGPQNREVKVWASSSEEGWLLPRDTESWRCIQTLELQSSEELRMEEAFFNQVVGLSRVGLLLLANAKKNAIYAVHLEYGASPVETRMDYLAEFTVTMPILSCTGTSDVLPHGEHIVQVYCVQTQAIQQYALDLSQCLPPPIGNLGLEKSNSSVSRHASEGLFIAEPPGSNAFEIPLANPAAKPSDQNSFTERKPGIRGPVSSSSDPLILQDISSSSMEPIPALVGNPVDVVSVALPSIPLSPRLTQKLSDLHGDQAPAEYTLDRPIDSAQTHLSGIPFSDDVNRIQQGNVTELLNPPIMFKHPTHLVTPSEIMATSSSEVARISEEKGEGEAKIQDVLVNNDVRNVELEVKIVGEVGFSPDEASSFLGEQPAQNERKEKSFSSQASDLGVDLSRELRPIPTETSVLEYPQSTIMEVQSQPSSSGVEVDETTNDCSGRSADFSATASIPLSPVPSSKGKNKKGKNAQAAGPLSPSPSILNSTDSLNEVGVSSSVPSLEDVSSRIVAMQDMVNQLVATQKEMQKQVSVLVNVSITKEGRRLEAALGRSIEKAAKANSDALWARFLEENAKNEKLIRDRTQQILNVVTGFVNKDLVAVLEKTIKKELATVSATVSRTVTPVIEKAIASSITESFQRGVGDKAVNQLDRSVSSKIEGSIARQIQAQFQTSGRQALQDGLKSTLEASLVPAFEMSCKAMFEQVDAAFQNGMAEHTASVQHQMESVHSPLSHALREAMSSVSSITQTLTGELADGQRKLIALAAAAAGASSKAAVNPLLTQLSNGSLAGLHEKVEQQPFDPTKELSRLISEHKYEEAFTAALQRSDVLIVSWLCSQVDLAGILAMVPTPLSQGVLLSLLQQLSCDVGKDTARKLAWMTDVTMAINPADPMIAMHVRPIFEQVYQILNHLRSSSSSSSSLPSSPPAQVLSSIRIIMHVINSMLTTCK